MMNTQVRLRPTTREDLPQRVAWMNDYDVTEFTGGDVGDSTLEKAEEKLATRTDPDWTIEVDGRAIGMCGLHLDKSKLNAGLGIVIGEKDCWGKGYGTAALREVLRLAFAEMQLHRVHLHAFPGNARGLRCYEKCGFRREGLLVQAHWKRGRWLDVITMAILKEEWESRRGAPSVAGKSRHPGPPKADAGGRPADQVALRPYRDTDHPAVVALFEAVGLGPGPNEAREKIAWKLATQPGFFFVAECNGKLVGTVVGSLERGWGWVQRLAVHPDYRRRGIAKRLMQEAEKAHAALGAYRTILLTGVRNAAAKALCHSLGYETWEHAIVMSRDLTKPADEGDCCGN